MKHAVIKGVIKSFSLETPLESFENTTPVIGENAEGNGLDFL